MYIFTNKILTILLENYWVDCPDILIRNFAKLVAYSPPARRCQLRVSRFYQTSWAPHSSVGTVHCDLGRIPQKIAREVVFFFAMLFGKVPKSKSTTSH